MQTKISCLMSLSLLTFAGCASDEVSQPYRPISDFNRVPLKTVHPADTTVAEAVNPPFTLTQCIEIALKNNPDVVGGGYDVLTAKAEKDIAAGQRWPTIGIKSGYRHYVNDQRLVPPQRADELGVFGDDMLSCDVVLKMPIFTAGRIENDIKAADLLSQSATHQLARTRRELVFNVSQVFYNILAQRYIIKSLDFSKKTLEEHLKRVTDLISVQKAAKVDLLRTKVRLADIEQRLLTEKNLMLVLRRVLVNFLGVSNTRSKIDIKGDLELRVVNADLSESISKAYSQRADYLSIKKKVQAEQKRLDIARAGHWPIVSAEASYGLRNAVGPTSRPSGTDETEYVGFVGVSIELPIFEGGAIDARIRSHQFRLWSLIEDLRKVKLQINLDVETAVLNIASSQKRVQATAESIEQAKESLRIEREKYDLGKGSITDVLDAQSSLLDAQTVYYHALGDYNIAVAQWYLAIGDKR